MDAVTAPTPEEVAAMVAELRKPAPALGLEEWDPTYYARQDAATMLRAVQAAREAAERVCEAAGAYFDGYCQDEADSRQCCIDDEQHDAAAAFRDAVRAWRATRAQGGEDE